MKSTFTSNYSKTILLLCAMVLVFAGANKVSAQITNGFELDGDANSVAPNPPDDWDLIYNGTSHAQVTSGIISDQPSGNGDNGFVQGSNDKLDIPALMWSGHSNPDKDDLLHAGAALYNNSDLYFFADRYAQNGDAQIGIWFYRDNVYPLPNGHFNGVHMVGDLLLLSNFTQGGGVATILAYEWVGSGGSDGSLNLLSPPAGAMFAITNVPPSNSPWPYTPKSGPVNVFPTGGIYEGGIDLTTVSLGDCFNSFLIETRSSASVTAELKDLIIGSFSTRPIVSLPSLSMCAGSGPVTITPTVSGGILPLTYSWSTGATTPSITVNPSSTTTYSVTITSASGCVSGPITDTVTVHPTYSTSQNASTCANVNYNLPWGGVGVAGANVHHYNSVNGCDSMVTIILTIKPTFNTSQNASTCANVAYTLPWGGTGVAGANVHHYTAQDGCDSTVTINLTINPTFTTSQNASTCANVSYTLPWGGTGVSGANIHHYTAQNTCDSMVTINLTILPTFNTSQNASTCANVSYTLPWGGTGVAGPNVHHYTAVDGCDSMVTINLTINPTFNTSQNASTCANVSYTLPWGGTGVAGPNVHHYAAQSGCDSMVTINLTILPVFSTSQNASTCANVPYTLPWGGTGVAGANVHHYTAQDGCDSMVTINLTINPTFNTSQNASTCSNVPYTLPWGGTGVAGANVHHYTAGDGCDSMVTINLTMLPTFNTSQNASSCANVPYTLPWGGTGVAGANVHHYTAVDGCDSMVTINLTINPTFTTSQNASTCSNVPYTLPWGGTGVAGANVHHYTAQDGCDSMVTINLTILPIFNTSQNASTCDNVPYTLPWGGTGVAGANVHHYTAQDGCDSMVTINLTINPTFNTNQNAATCSNQPYTLPWGGIGVAGANTHVYTAGNGCDSTVTINLTINPAYNTSQNASTCSNVPYTLPWGGIGVVGANTHLYTAGNGCDSTVTINLTINPTYNTSQNVSTCTNVPYTLPWGGTGVAGQNTHLYTAGNGCDSMVTINLTVNPTYSTSQNASTCDNHPYNLPWGGIGVVGANTHLYQSVGGCDSTVTINLTINPTFNTSQNASTCANVAYTLPWGGTGIAGANTHVYTAADGCDSTVTINLTINPTFNTSQNASTCSNVPYTLPWGGVGVAGANTHVYGAGNGCDSTVTINLTFLPVYNTSQNASTCNNQPYPLPWGGFGVSGANSHLYSSVGGCDSTATINLTINPIYNTSQSASTCDNHNFNLPWGGVGVAGANTHLYQSVNGCDSMVTINLTINPTFSTSQVASSCSNVPYTLPWGGTGVNGANTHVYHSVNGCDSTVTINLTINQAPSCTINSPLIPPVCSSLGDTITVSVSSGTGPFTYSWTVNGSGWSITSGNGSSQVIYTAGSSGNGNFHVVVTDANGCTSSCNLSVSCTSPFNGCTLGFWKNHPQIWHFTNQSGPACIAAADLALGSPYGGGGTIGASFALTFGVSAAQMTAAGYANPNMTLLQALNLGGGGFFNLARQGVAALLNTCSFSQTYPYTTNQILTDVHNAIINLTPEPLATNFDSANETQPEACPDAGSAQHRPSVSIYKDGLNADVYPNPFNSSATIEFGSELEDAHITVQVFSVSGALVASLFNGDVIAGEMHTVEFDGHSFADGMYFYRVTTDNNTINGKMILMRK